jgi:SpoVK/Ycf46/Vps4 family AAA+-type ATPase
LFGDADRAAKLVGLADPLARAGSSLVLSGHAADLPPSIQRHASIVALEPPSEHEYYQFVNAVLSDLRERVPVRMEMSPDEAAALIAHLKGLTLFEVRKIITHAILRDGRLAKDDLEFVLRHKQSIVEQSGVLEYFAAERGLEDIAGLSQLKRWLKQRSAVFEDPARAQQFGLEAPKGLLLVGVQGCGKSLCAKATARAWGLPLLRLDPGRLYTKYLGESEQNFRKAIKLAERLAPIVLWIDELEKAFGSAGRADDGGASQRLFGTFLTWLQEKRASVFVVATSNDITGLPPELLRKGRFDEIFFVDLPDEAGRAQILALHLRRRQRDPQQFDLTALAQSSEGFSGAELEQVVVAALYHAFSEGCELAERHVRHEIARTHPLSVTLAEPIATLRHWARGRTVPAD